jgi:poly(3-hydroxybutyrate) depolymerase
VAVRGDVLPGRAACLGIVALMSTVALLVLWSETLAMSTSPMPLALGAAKPAAATPARAIHDAPPPLLRGTQRRILRWLSQNVVREVVEVAPARHSGPLPLVVVLHGRRQTPWRAEGIEHWDALAGQGRAVIAYGAGIAGSWNAGTCCGLAQRRGIDDVDYVRRLLWLEEHRHAIDRHRVFLVGFSNGGMLAYRFACVHPDAISALVVVAGSLQVPSCRPSRPLTVLDVEGDRDHIVPYDGTSYSRVAGAATRSIPESLRPWQEVAGKAAVVRLVRLPELGHEWPTIQHGGWDGTTAIWRFLVGRSSIHAMPSVAASSSVMKSAA